MKKRPLAARIFGILLVVVVLLCSIPGSIGARAGDYGDWGGDFGGSDSDWGGSGSDWGGSSSDWGSSRDDDDDDWGDGGFFFFGIPSSCESLFCSCPTIILIIVVIIIIIVLNNKKKQNGGHASVTPPVIQMGDTSRVDTGSLEALRKSDPNFSEAAILSWAENLYTTMQIAWSNQDYEEVRPFLGNALFEEHAKSLAAKIGRDEKNERSEIAVLQKKLESFRSDGHNEYLNIWLRIKQVDKLVKRSDPSVVLQAPKTFYMDFRWQLARTAGAVTEAATDGVKTGVCPNCGANINMNQSGKCPYCDSVITTEEHNWVLNKIDALQQRSR